MTYYKGNLISVKEIYMDPRVETFDLKEEKGKLLENLIPKKLIVDPTVISFLEKYYVSKNQKEFKKVNNLEGVNIVYIIVKDKDNNLYGKELMTGCLFPILTPAHLDFSYRIESIELKKKVNIVVEKNISSYSLYIPDVLVVGSQEISSKDASFYREQFNKGILKRKKKEKFITGIKELYCKNYPKINTKDELDNESLTKIQMKNIESLIVDLMEINQKLALDFKKEYESIIGKGFKAIELANLEIDIHECLLFKDQGELEVIKYLNSCKKEYLMNLLSGNKTIGLTIKNLDKFTTILLAENYSSYAKNKIKNTLALLYFFEVYEEKNNITLSELESSCIKDFLNYIISCIKYLKELGIIIYDKDLELNSLSVGEVFNIIKEIEFRKMDEEKVKKIVLSY